MNKSLGKKDRQLLNLLQEDSQLSNVQLADRLDLTPSSCWRKVRALEDSGVIDHYTVALRPESLNLNFEAIVHLQLDRHDAAGVNALTEVLKSRAEVIDCYATTGVADFQMRVLCSDKEAYNEFLDNVLFKISGIRSAQTNMVLKSIKSGSKITL